MQATCILTFSLGADQAGWGVTERAQDGSYGQAQVLVARVQSDRGEAQVRQAGSFLRTNLYMRDLPDGERNGGERRLGKARKANMLLLTSIQTQQEKTVSKEDPLEVLRAEKRDKKDGRGREQSGVEIKGHRKKGGNSRKKLVTVN